VLVYTQTQCTLDVYGHCAVFVYTVYTGCFVIAVTNVYWFSRSDHANNCTQNTANDEVFLIWLYQTFPLESSC